MVTNECCFFLAGQRVDGMQGDGACCAAEGRVERSGIVVVPSPHRWPLLHVRACSLLPYRRCPHVLVVVASSRRAYLQVGTCIRTHDQG